MSSTSLKNKAIQVRFDAETYDKLKAIAESDGRTIANFARMAIIAAIAAWENENES